MTDQDRSIKERIAEVQRKLANAQSRIPKHSPPVALLEEIDELEMELAKLQAPSLDARIADVERRLANAQSRIPQHSPPVALLVEIDELEDELAALRKQQGG